MFKDIWNPHFTASQVHQMFYRLIHWFPIDSILQDTWVNEITKNIPKQKTWILTPDTVRNWFMWIMLMCHLLYNKWSLQCLVFFILKQQHVTSWIKTADCGVSSPWCQLSYPWETPHSTISGKLRFVALKWVKNNCITSWMFLNWFSGFATRKISVGKDRFYGRFI